MKIKADLQEKNLFRILQSIVAIIAIGASIAQFSRFLFVAFSRAGYPFSLEWMESGSFVQVSRILAWQPLYVRPSFDFIPQIYPPAYFYISALASKLFGNTFFPLRFISILSTLAILILIFVLVYKHSGSKLGSLLASGLFCATYELSGYWFDIARVDSLALALLLLSAYLFLKDIPITSIWGGIALALSCLTKQTMIIAVGVFFIYCVLPPRKNSLIFIGSTVIGLGIKTLLLDWLHDGWYSYYIFHLPARHNIVPKINTILTSAKVILFAEIIKPIFFATIIGIIYILLFPSKPDNLSNDHQWNEGEPNQIWARRAIWILISVASLLAVGSLWYLAKLPSDLSRSVIGPYSFARILLMVGPLFAGVLIGILVIKLRNNPVWVDHITQGLFGKIQTVPRIVFGFIFLAGSSIIMLAYIKPAFYIDLSPAHLQRISPYLIGPLIWLVTLVIIWRFLWPSNYPKTWFFFLLSIGLVAISWLGRLNPGGYYNVFMPAHAGISILFGLGIGVVLDEQLSDKSKYRYLSSTLVLLLSSIQLFLLLSPTTSQIPTQADKQAGLELVSRIKACPGEVYIPFHTYLADLAGKKGYAGVVEMGELRGSFGGKADPIWDEVLNQIQLSLEMKKFEAIIQDNQIFRDVFSTNYIEADPVFENETVFWEITGRKIRPEIIYESIDGTGCILTVK